MSRKIVVIMGIWKSCLKEAREKSIETENWVNRCRICLTITDGNYR